jgi:hypothetical protein
VVRHDRGGIVVWPLIGVGAVSAFVGVLGCAEPGELREFFARAADAIGNKPGAERY